MATFKFVHAADLHLDSPLRAPRATGRAVELLRDATFRAFSRIVDLCLRERADFLVLAGDLFDFKDRSVRARLHLRRELQRLHEAGIATFIAHGNHDPLTPEAGALGLPASVTVFGPAWSEVPVSRGGAVVCRVQGISYAQERVTEDLSRHFRRLGPEFTVAVLHANVGGHGAHANYAPCSLQELAARGLDYWALGHVHTRAEYPLGSGGVAVYPGNPQGRHVNEPGPRGCVLVEVDGGRSTTRFVPLEPVRWHRLGVDLSGCATVDALVARVEDAVDEACPEGFDAHALRLVLEGRGPLHRELSRPEGLAGLEEDLRGSLGARHPPVVLESIEDRGRPELDVEALRALGGLPAQVLEVAAQAAKSGAAFEALWDAEELPKLEGALKRAQVRSPREDAQALLEAACARALELLAEEAP